MTCGIVIIALVSRAFADPTVATDTGQPGFEAAPPDAQLPVTGGTHITDNTLWPDAAAIAYYNALGYVECSGTLITPDVVITAGHCVNGAPRDQPTQVILGTTDYRHPGEAIDVSEVIEYPDSQGRGYDVGILILAHPSSYEPRTIATDCIRDYIVDGAAVNIVGYGAYDSQGNQYDSLLRQGDSVITDADCSDVQRGCSPSLTPNGEVGAGENGVDACFGDSGGPLYLPTPKGTYLLGATSRGWYTGSVPCGQGGVWVRPDSPRLSQWIEDTTGETLAHPACLDPTAPTLYTIKNKPGFSQISVTSGGTAYTYAIEIQPEHGGASVSATGLVQFTPDFDYEGEDYVTASVTADDGESGIIRIPIAIVSRSQYHNATGEHAPGGCATTPAVGGGAAGLALAGLLLVRRRRRSVA